MTNIQTLATKSSPDYELLDSGEGQKLERFGGFVLSRPDPQALWRKRLAPGEWKKAYGIFNKGSAPVGGQENKGGWSVHADLPAKWQVELAGLKFWIKPTAFKHVGIFPEQTENWKWLETVIGNWLLVNGKRKSQKAGHSDDKHETDASESIEVLNLFGYTGGATLACAKAGAKVVHVDGSKVAMVWARDNAELSGLKDKPVRWILDDARDFVRREAKRGRRYDGIVMDPPAFGHGPEGGLWKIEDDFLPLIDDCMKILKDKPLFFLINGYSAGYSAIAYENNLSPLAAKFGGKVEIGELTIEEKDSERLLPCGIFARWSA